MLKIERLNLRLPNGFGPRAAAIAHLIGGELNTFSWSSSVDMATLRVPPLQLTPNAGDREIARSVATAIAREINGGKK